MLLELKKPLLKSLNWNYKLNRQLRNRQKGRKRIS
nr:MAG TPA: hypothetical protein [Bacteriophage sp.]